MVIIQISASAEGELYALTESGAVLEFDWLRKKWKLLNELGAYVDLDYNY